MPTNKSGKIFEKNFSQAAERQKIFCLRLNDSSQAYQQETLSKTHFTAHNRADFILFYDGFLFPVECKSTKFSSISIQRSESDPKCMIKKHQIDSLIKMSEYENVICGFVLNYRVEEDNGDIIDDDTYFITIQQFSNFLYENDKKSINKLDIINYGGIRIECKKLRKYFTYNVKGLFNKIIEADWLSKEGLNNK